MSCVIKIFARSWLLLIVAAVTADRVSAVRPRPRPCDPSWANHPPESTSPKWRPGNYRGCLGGTADAPGSGFCEQVWCGSGTLKIEGDPTEVYAGKPATVTIHVEGPFETGGNVILDGNAEVDWGDGSSEALPASKTMRETRTHVYAKPGLYYPSARLMQEFKYHGTGSCSYRCDVRRAAVAVVYPAMIPPHLHVVSQGESLTTIVRQYGLNSWAATYLANKRVLPWPDMVYAGQTLLIVDNLPKSFSNLSQPASRLWKWLFHESEPYSEKRPPKASAAEFLDAFTDWVNDKQKEAQIEGGRRELEARIKSELGHGAKVVVVRVATYSIDRGSVNRIEWWGTGDTALQGIAKGLGPSYSEDFGPAQFDADESYFSAYSMENGQLKVQDMPKGWYTSGDAQKIRAQAARERETALLGRELDRQLKEAKDKHQIEVNLQQEAANARSSSSARSAANEAPINPRTVRTPGGKSGQPQHKEGDGLPQKTDQGGGAQNANSAGPNGGSSSNGYGLPPSHSIPINGEHPGQPGKGGDQGIPIGGVPPPPNGPNPDHDISIRPQSLLRLGLGASAPFLVPVSLQTYPAMRQSLASQYVIERVQSSSTSQLAYLIGSVIARDEAFWGYPSSRTWLDVNGDGIEDFCRIVPGLHRAYILRCTLAKGRAVDERYAGESFDTPINNFSSNTRGHWAPIDGNGHFGYCRVVASGKLPQLSQLICIPVVGNKFETEISSSEPVKVGMSWDQAWLDFNGDGKIDFCTLFERSPGQGQLACYLSDGKQFNVSPILSRRLHWRGRYFRRWIKTVDGKAEFCTVAGNGSRFMDCTVSDKNSFGETYRDLLDRDKVQ